MILKKIKQIVGTVALAGALYLSGCASQRAIVPELSTAEKPAVAATEKPEGKTEGKTEGKKIKMSVTPQLFYSPKDEQDTIRAIYTSKLPASTEIWGLIDIDGRHYFALTTADKKIAGDIYAGIEHRSGDDFDDFTKAGIMYKGTPIKGGPFVKLKAMQKLDDDTDTTLGILVDQDLGKGFSFEAFLDRDIEAESFYGEATLKFKPIEQLELLLQGRSGGSIHDKIEVDTFIGVGYKF